MANGNFIVQNGLQVGPLTIDAATGSIQTSGCVTITGGLGVSSISKNDSSLTINDTGTGSSVVINIDGTTVHTIDSNGVNLGSGDYYSINGTSVLNSTTLGSGVVNSSLTSVGTLTSLSTGAITTTGTLALNAAGGLTTNQTTFPLVNTTATTVNFAGAATTINMGASTGTTTLNSTTGSTSSSTGALVVKGGLGVAGQAWFGGDIHTSGNLYVANLVSVNSSITQVTSPLLYLESSTVYPYNYDIGSFSHFVGGPANVYAHTGLVRSSANGYWGFFSNVKQEPALGGAVNWADAGLVWDKIKAGDLILANATASSSTTTGALQVAGGAGIAGAVNVGGAMNIAGQITSTVATGTAPFVVASTTAVTNLNADLWDGQHFATYLNQAVLTSSSPTFAGLTTTAAILPNTNGTLNIGSASNYFATVYGKATTAQYADLAENYLGDKYYTPGTVVMFGGEAEVTLATADTTAVAGVVSTNPAHLMNGALTGPNVVPVAFTGRVPCNVIGPVKKGDIMVSAGFGFAKVNNEPKVGSIIGKALQDFPVASKGVIEVVVGRF